MQPAHDAAWVGSYGEYAASARFDSSGYSPAARHVVHRGETFVLRVPWHRKKRKPDPFIIRVRRVGTRLSYSFRRVRARLQRETRRRVKPRVGPMDVRPYSESSENHTQPPSSASVVPESSSRPLDSTLRRGLRRALNGVVYLASANDAQMAGLVDLMREQRVLRGEAVFSQGQPGEHLFVVESGLFRASDSDAAAQRRRRTRTLTTLPARDNPAATFTAPTATIVAVTTTHAENAAVTSARTANHVGRPTLLELCDSVGQFMSSLSSSVRRRPSPRPLHRQHAAARHRVHDYSPGDWFGEFALLEGCTRSTTVHCIRDGRLWTLRRTDVAHVLCPTRPPPLATVMKKVTAAHSPAFVHWPLPIHTAALPAAADAASAVGDAARIAADTAPAADDRVGATSFAVTRPRLTAYGGVWIEPIGEGGEAPPGRAALLDRVRRAEREMLPVQRALVALGRTDEKEQNRCAADSARPMVAAKGMLAQRAALSPADLPLPPATARTLSSLGDLQVGRMVTREGGLVAAMRLRQEQPPRDPSSHASAIASSNSPSSSTAGNQAGAHAGFALKIARKATVARRKHVAHALGEVAALSRCGRHPMVVALAGAHADAAHLYSLYELTVVHGDLHALLESRRRLEEHEARFYVACTLLALEHLSSPDVGVAHRNLRPESLLLDSRGYPKLSSFEFARVVAPGERAYTVCGSVRYMAPEQMLRAGHDARVDMWALGVMFFELLHARPPFAHDEPADPQQLPPPDEDMINSMAVRVLRQPQLAYNPRLASPAAVEVLSSLLHRDPNKRVTARRWSATHTSALRELEFFAGVAWDELLRRAVRPPIYPPVQPQWVVPSIEECIERWHTRRVRAKWQMWRSLYNQGRLRLVAAYQAGQISRKAYRAALLSRGAHTPGRVGVRQTAHASPRSCHSGAVLNSAYSRADHTSSDKAAAYEIREEIATRTAVWRATVPRARQPVGTPTLCGVPLFWLRPPSEDGVVARTRSGRKARAQASSSSQADDMIGRQAYAGGRHRALLRRVSHGAARALTRLADNVTFH